MKYWEDEDEYEDEGPVFDYDPELEGTDGEFEDQYDGFYDDPFEPDFYDEDDGEIYDPYEECTCPTCMGIDVDD